jgi:hypothetical protein
MIFTSDSGDKKGGNPCKLPVYRNVSQNREKDTKEVIENQIIPR